MKAQSNGLILTEKGDKYPFNTQDQDGCLMRKRNRMIWAGFWIKIKSVHIKYPLILSPHCYNSFIKHAHIIMNELKKKTKKF